MGIVRNSPQLVNHAPTLLAEAVEDGHRWDSRKGQALQAAAILKRARSIPLWRMADRMTECANTLTFGWVSDSDGVLSLGFRDAHFCRVRVCPICQQRESMKITAYLHRRIPGIEKQYPGHRWLFLTLTMRNPHISQLRESIKELNTAFARLRRRKDWPAVGWIKSVEITHGRDGNPHPHMHVLLLVKPSYFTDGYIKKSRWGEIWSECLQVQNDYTAVTDIRAVKPNAKNPKNRMAGVIAEIGKYTTKPTDLTANPEFFQQYTQQIANLRLRASGGVLRGILGKCWKGLELDKPEPPQVGDNLFFDWYQPHYYQRQD